MIEFIIFANVALTILLLACVFGLTFRMQRLEEKYEDVDSIVAFWLSTEQGQAWLDKHDGKMTNF